MPFSYLSMQILYFHEHMILAIGFSKLQEIWNTLHVFDFTTFISYTKGELIE